MTLAGEWYDMPVEEWQLATKKSAERGQLTRVQQSVGDFRKKTKKLDYETLAKLSERELVSLLWAQHEVLSRAKGGVLQKMCKDKNSLLFVKELFTS